MRAMIYREFGPAEVMHYEDLPDPVPGAGEIKIEVHACSVNRVLDVAVRAGKQPQRNVQLPHVGGVDPVGVVTALGEGVTDRKIGDHVAVFQGLGHRKMFGIHCWGGYAQYTKAPATATCVVPKGVSFADACVLARHAPVAWNLMVNLGKLKKDEWVLVMGAAGNLGSIGIQLAKNIGARVIACAGSDDRAEIGRQLGADHVINYKKADLKSEVTRLTGGHGLDMVYDNIANPETTSKAIDAHGRAWAARHRRRAWRARRAGQLLPRLRPRAHHHGQPAQPQGGRDSGARGGGAGQDARAGGARHAARPSRRGASAGRILARHGQDHSGSDAGVTPTVIPGAAQHEMVRC